MASSDPKIATQGQWEDLASRIKAKADASDIPIVDTGYSASSNNAIANSTVTNSLDRDVVTNIALDTNPSTTSVNINNTKTNLATPSSSTTTTMPLPVASTTQAGVINSATFNAITKNTQDIANIIGEVVAISGLPASPTQAELTTAWLNASGESALINGAGIYDVTNTKRWTYYSNDTTWHAVDASGSVTVNQWTNNSAGIVKGSTNVGQIFAENDGTGSVNGWDALNGTVSSNTSKLATIEQGAEVNEVEIGSVVSTPSSVEYVDTNNIANEAVTTAKIDLGAVTTSKIADGAVTSDKIDFTTLGFANYRDTEQDTGFTWLNGEPIYSKTINFGALPNGGVKDVAHGIAYDRIVDVRGFAQFTNGTLLPLPFVNVATLNYGIVVLINTTNISVDVGGADRSSATAYFTLYYTKSS